MGALPEANPQLGAALAHIAQVESGLDVKQHRQERTLARAHAAEAETLSIINAMIWDCELGVVYERDTRELTVRDLSAFTR